ncbi:MAG: helix-hairpin-helix domain-containing protein [Myxococcaceae bacterium]|nr:helix-hairpin-helix domain-containing protein [Myxococcaceae bacterium]
MLLGVWLVASTAAQAAIFERPVDIEDADDLESMYERQELSTEDYEALRELLEEGVDLNSADRDALYELPGLNWADVDAIIAYRQQKGRIENPVELVAAKALTEEQLLEITPFIRLDPAPDRVALSGKYRFATAYTVGDNVPLPTLGFLNLKGPYDLSGGVAFTTTRLSPGTPRFDPLHVDALQVDGRMYRFELPRYYLQWKAGQRRVVVGSYFIGFAERVTLDNSRHRAPTGIYLSNDFRRDIALKRTCQVSVTGATTDVDNLPCSGDVDNLYVTPDFDWREPFRGAAASVEKIDLGAHRRLSLYGFVSYQSRSLYQYKIYNRETCDDPSVRDEHGETTPNCKAPPVFLAQHDPLAPDAKVIFATLPNLYNELIGGGHVTFDANERLRLGVTAYGAANFFYGAPLKLDFQDWAATPYGGPFGAVGIDGKFTAGHFDFYLEGARSFDSTGKGGGFAVLQRTEFDYRKHSVELALRYYDNTYDNPYARPISAPDQVEGLRARNELGARLTYQGRFGDWNFTSRADGWVLPYADPKQGPAGMANLYFTTALELRRWPVFEPAVWGEMRNRNLASSVHGTCASGTIIYVENGDVFACSGDLYRATASLTLRPLGRRLNVIMQGSLTWKDDVRYKTDFRRDVRAFIELRSQVNDTLSLRLKSRYLNEDIVDNTYLEQSLWSFFEVGAALHRALKVTARYDLYAFLDKRAATLTRKPNPEHRLYLNLQGSF